MSLRDGVQELLELGARRSLYRVGRELHQRTGLAARERPALALPAPDTDYLASLPFASARAVATRVAGSVTASERERTLGLAHDALRGKILCFGRWIGDFGDPIDWYRNPLSGARWPHERHWSRAMSPSPERSDIKLAWEPARFPQALLLARAAAMHPDQAPALFRGFTAMVRAFIDATPYPLGIHWASTQECAIRLGAWLFATRAFADLGERSLPHERSLTAYARVCGRLLHDEIGYARHAVYNNHLLSEALGLCLTAWLCPDEPGARRWHALGIELLTEQSAAQVYEDGAYINQSHNYHRTIAQELLFASRWHRSALGAPEPDAWRDALDRSLTFLVAHQNPTDGRLPNFGANDGSMPRPLSCCDFSDFRPTLQALSLHLRGERLYPEGPWDEEAAWYLGPSALEAPLRQPVRRSVSFGATGYHILRGDDPSSFACLRCGSVRDRFGQIDMLHTELWWKGHEVLADGGTWLYSGPDEWHAHFFGTASHNTVTVDGRDQMLHYRRFKFLYWTRASLLAFVERDGHTLAVGEHHGYARHPGRVVHRRSVLRVGDDLWIVADCLLGTGRHDARLHWLCGPVEVSAGEAGATLLTPAGALSLSVHGPDGAPRALDLARGQRSPPRGWRSRYFGERTPATSIVQEDRGTRMPWTRVTVIAPGQAEVRVNAERWSVHSPGGVAAFTLRDGAISLEDAP